MHSVALSKDARRFFERADASLQRRLDRCFDRLKVEPHHGGNIKPLKGTLTGARIDIASATTGSSIGLMMRSRRWMS